jgi:hypothetical protein
MPFYENDCSFSFGSRNPAAAAAAILFIAIVAFDQNSTYGSLA